MSAAVYAQHHLHEAETRAVVPTTEAIEALDQLGGDLSDDGQSPEQVLDLLHRVGSPATVMSAGPRYFGFVTGGSLPAATGAQMLATAWDQNGAYRVMSPVAAKLEDIALGWLRDVLGIPAGASGAFVTGATLANLTCLAAARHALLERAGWDVEAEGLWGAPPIQVVAGEEIHASMRKALGLLGMGRNRYRAVPTDAQGRLDADRLGDLDSNTIVCLQAGNVNTGALDQAREICSLAKQAGAWVHVDGAFGLWAQVSPLYRHLADGYAEADSWATDAHKWLNVPYDCGIAFVRDASAHYAAMSVGAAYLKEGTTREAANFGPDMSRRARGVEVWAALRSLGRKGLAELIERTCSHATRFADGLRAAGFAVLHDVALNQVMVSFGDDERTARIIDAIQKDGTCWCGSTIWKGRRAMRISVSSWKTQVQDVDLSLAAMIRIAAATP